ncbi:hypothetical protein [Cryobacterium tepidiphilum]|uniref:Alpha/beta hydrolase n=1 Tax=Cryobacterium tepidiphilum TaxID=2486026 RepID=A0A3M8LM24_9MICO|nr:hypothetical protein [Cryobacterium tepidiphilum]RNE66451.1 hypothetical protein EEJ31_03335 [Cryobacterium tepidiphilum]
MSASPPTHIAQKSITRTGNGDFTFEGAGKLAGRPLHVWYNAPADLANARILIVMTGTQRDGEDYRADWVPLLKNRNTLLLVPEFSEDDYPGVSSYNLGSIIDEDGHLQPQAEWSFNMIESLFASVVAETHSSATGYELFGHSAGAQFVHRFMEFMPETKATIAVAANAGWYTVLDESVRFPYGMKGAPVRADDMKEAFKRQLVILLGADDIDPHDSSLQRDRHTDQQGTDRLARGLNFYRTAREYAGESATFNWRLIVVPGIAHSHGDMARAALPILLPE